MSAEDFLPDRWTLTSLRRAAATCRGCPLYRHATQTVFGEGLLKARAMIVGEVPGDQEDRQGEPFVGPAGRVLDEALEQAGIRREDAYVTNAVKHFKFEERGKRRLHKKPAWSEIKACRPWLLAEIEVVRPEVIVCLGATAAQSLLGREFRITRQRGQWITPPGMVPVMATYHPSAILRAPEKEARQRMQAELIEDLSRVAERLMAGEE